MRPFLLLSIRAEPRAAAEEAAAFARFLGVPDAGLVVRRLGEHPLGPLDLDEWSGVLLGGGAFTASDPEASKSPEQLRAEADVDALLDQVVAADFPFLGACYGIGTLGRHQGGAVDRRFPEPVGPLAVSLTDEGRDDPLFAGLPDDFAAYGGHKEALSQPPAHAVTLATSSACPVQAFRVGTRVYATQFHPELDLAGVLTRIEVYADYGYFDPAEVAALSSASRAVEVTHPMTVLRTFAALFAR